MWLATRSCEFLGKTTSSRIAYLNSDQQLDVCPFEWETWQPRLILIKHVICVLTKQEYVRHAYSNVLLRSTLLGTCRNKSKPS